MRVQRLLRELTINTGNRAAVKVMEKEVDWRIKSTRCNFKVDESSIRIISCFQQDFLFLFDLLIDRFQAILMNISGLDRSMKYDGTLSIFSH